MPLRGRSDSKPVAEAPSNRHSDPKHDDHPRRRCPDCDPDCPGEWMADKRTTRDDLVGERQGEGEVHVQVDDPPRLVLEVPSGDSDRGDPGHNEQTETDRRSENVRIGSEKDPELVKRSNP